MKVLIIGGAGYIGSTLSRELWEQGHEVTVFDALLFGDESVRSLIGERRFELVQGDIRDREALAEVVPGHDAVCLLAAIVGEPACNRDPETAVEVNLQGARNVAQAALAAGIPRFVFTSTCSNYGVSDRNGLVNEEAPLQPISTYSETKVTAEQELLAMKSESFHPTVLRLSTAFGISERMRFDLLVSDFTLAAQRDRKIVIYGGGCWRPFVHVNDIAAAFQSVLQVDIDLVSGEVFNVGTNDANVQKLELGERIQQELPETEIELVQNNADPRSYRVDFTKVNSRLGYRPRHSIRDGIRELRVALEAGQWSDPSAPQYHN